MNKSVFGYMPDGTEVEQYILNSGNISCAVLTYGGALRSLTVPLCFGLASGAYSSICLAPAIWVKWKESSDAKKLAKGKK